MREHVTVPCRLSVPFGTGMGADVSHHAVQFNGTASHQRRHLISLFSLSS